VSAEVTRLENTAGNRELSCETVAGKVAGSLICGATAAFICTIAFFRLLGSGVEDAS
jgi:hypothetical protein